MDLTSLEYRQAIAEDYEEILKISALQLGEGYLTKNELAEKAVQQNTFIPVVLIEERLIGYSIIFLDEKRKLVDYGLEKCHDHLTEFSDDSRIQIRKTTAIHPGFTGMGIGSRLVNFGLFSLENSCDMILSVNWKQNNSIPMASTSQKNEMKELCEVENYWKAESIEKQFICPECGPPPCTCSAVIYFKKVK